MLINRLAIQKSFYYFINWYWKISIPYLTTVVNEPNPKLRHRHKNGHFVGDSRIISMLLYGRLTIGQEFSAKNRDIQLKLEGRVIRY